MQVDDAFLTLAELSIALAGFTSVVVVFSQRGGDFRPVDRVRIQNGLWTSLGPALLSLLPAALELLGASGPDLWRAASAALFLYAVLFLRSSIPRMRSLSDADRALFGKRSTVWLIGSGSLVNLVLQPLNVSGMLFEPNPGVLFLGLVSMLISSTLIFVRIVFLRPPSEETEA